MTTCASTAKHAWVRLIDRRAGPKLALAAAACVVLPSPLTPAVAEPPSASVTASETPGVPGIDAATAMARFLDRLMLAESGGRDDARNPRSTALGPFQFIESTFLEVARRHFGTEIVGLTPAQILAKRTDRSFARRAAEAYSRDNAAALAGVGLEATYANLRLAFLVGSGGAIRVLKAHPATLTITALGTSVVQANPFMAGMTTADLSAWSARNLAASDLVKAQVAAVVAGAPAAGSGASGTRVPQAKPAINVRCERGLASCRRWVALATRRVQKGEQVAARKVTRGVPR